MTIKGQKIPPFWVIQMVPQAGENRQNNAANILLYSVLGLGQNRPSPKILEEEHTVGSHL